MLDLVSSIFFAIMSSTARANESHFPYLSLPQLHGRLTKNTQVTVSYLGLDMQRVTGAHVYSCFKVNGTESAPILDGNELLPSKSPGPGAIALHGRAHSVQAATRWCFYGRWGIRSADFCVQNYL